MAAFATPTLSCWFISRRKAAPLNGGATLLTELELLEALLLLPEEIPHAA
jgi:hypothetical protein